MPKSTSEGDPLNGIRVIEMAGLGPAPFAAMMLADLGAEVIRVERPSDLTKDYSKNEVLERRRRRISIDLKQETGKDVVRRLVRSADVLIEGYRPGVMERLGLGPERLLTLNPSLIYGRISGWGQAGPLSQKAGHDINYIATTGALDMIGHAGSKPIPPLNLVGDFGGAGNSLVIGITSSLFERSRTGHGRVIDANVFDATNTLMSLIHGLYAADRWSLNRGTNLLDSGCPYYDTYECYDGRYMAVGAIEYKFFKNMLDAIGVGYDERLLASHKDKSLWPMLREVLTEKFLMHDREHWETVFKNIDSCVSPVLDIEEAAAQPHAQARRSFTPIHGRGFQPAVSPRLNDTDPSYSNQDGGAHDQTEAILSELGYCKKDVHEILRIHSAAQSA